MYASCWQLFPTLCRNNAYPVQYVYHFHKRSEGLVVPKDRAEGRQGLLRLLGVEPTSPGTSTTAEAVDSARRLVRVVEWDGYKRIDRHEVAHGLLKGKPREKLVQVKKMLEIADEEDCAL